MLLWISLAAAGPAYDLLRLRDPVGCADLGPATTTLREELVALTDAAVRPSLVQVRAASCLGERFATDAAAQALFAGWMTDPESAGLALAVLHHAADLPPPLAQSLAERALASPNRRVAAFGQQALAVPTSDTADAPASTAVEPAP